MWWSQLQQTATVPPQEVEASTIARAQEKVEASTLFGSPGGCGGIDPLGSTGGREGVDPPESAGGLGGVDPQGSAFGRSTEMVVAVEKSETPSAQLSKNLSAQQGCTQYIQG